MNRYRASFSVPAAVLAHRNVDLQLSGLDTAVAVALNDRPVLSAANMHRTFLVDAHGLLERNNTLEFLFTGPVPASLAAEAACVAKHGPHCADSACVCPSPWPGPAPQPLLINAYLRKEQQSFSWDFAPATGTSGITAEPMVVGYDSALLRDLVIDTQPLTAGRTTGWRVTVAVRLWSSRGPAPGAADATLVASMAELGASATEPVKIAVGETVQTLHLTIAAGAGVKRWWPNGYGEQHTYSLIVSLDFGRNQTTQTKTARVGFRTIVIDQPALPEGHGDGHLFRYVVNGQPIWARGSNFVPAESLQPRVTRRELRRLFDAYSAAHFTSLRVWGGGVYASDDFMELATQSGIIVSHDFMFGDQFYPTDGDFLRDVAAEVKDQAWRLGRHASLGAWFGNNEMAAGYSDDHHLFHAQRQYSQLYFETIHGNLTSVDPYRAWMSSTPSQGNETPAVPYNRGGSEVELRGDMHFYGFPDDDCWNVSAYPRARFITESGFESFPSFMTMAPTLAKTDYGFNASVPASRQQHPPGQQQITHNVKSNWRWPDRWPSNSASGYRDELWMTQVAASQCLTAAVEFWRGSSDELINTTYPLSPSGWAMLGGNAGVLYWQADDTWPGPSWSTIELGGRLKVGHYSMQRAFAPLLVAGRIHEGVLTVRFSNHGRRSLGADASLRCTAYKWSGGVAGTPLTHTIVLPAHGSSLLLRASLAEVLRSTGCPDRTQCVLALDVTTAQGDRLASNWVYLSPFHQVSSMIASPALAVHSVALASPPADRADLRAFNLTIAAQRIPVAVVWLETKLPGRFSDNGFLMVAHERQLQWTTDEVTVTASQLGESLSVRSLVDVSPGYTAQGSPRVLK